MTAQSKTSRETASRQLMSETLEGLRLVVEFSYLGDRFAHRLILGGDELSPAGQELFCSVEGDDQSAWPPSPPLQQLDECPLADGNKGLVGVGMAGQGHWSIAVEPLSLASSGSPAAGDHGDSVGFVFDVACRAAGFGELGSQYRIAAPTQLASCEIDDSTTLGFSLKDQPERSITVRLDALAPYGQLVASGNEMVDFEEQLRVIPAGVGAGANDDGGGGRNATRRWKYRWTLTTDG